MVKKRMAMRMVTIFVALIVCGMFFPDLARGAGLSSDQGFIVEFKELQLNEPSEIPVVITNESGKTLKLLPQFKSDGNCEFGFAYDGPWIIGVAPGESLSVSFTYTPSNYDECGAELKIVDMEGMVTLATITVIGVLEEMAEDPNYIYIGDINTDVEDRPINDDYNASTIGDIIEECETTAYNRGHLWRCVSLLTAELWREGRITYQEKRKLRSAAVKAEMRKMVHKMKTSKRLKTSKRSGRSRFWCWWRH